MAKGVEAVLNRRIDRLRQFAARPRPSYELPAVPLSWRRDLPLTSLLVAISTIYVRLLVTLRPGFFAGDILTFFLPFNTAVADRVRAWDIPGWSPALSSGMPLAGDPTASWVYLPVLISFLLFSPLTAYKIQVLVHIVAAGLATYFLARTLKMGPIGALAAGIAYVLSPFYHFAQCCTVRMQLGAWIPLGLLTVELALRSRTATTRLAWWGVSGIVISQIIAGYFGKGTYLGFLIVGAYLFYRTILAPDLLWIGFKQRLVNLAVHSVAILSLGIGFSAATLLPRLDFLSRSNLAGGSYNLVGSAAIEPPSWTVSQALSIVLDPSRPAYFIGAATAALAIAGVILSWRWFAVRFFAVFSLCAIVLTMKETPFHQLMYLLPRFKVIHEHAPQTVLVVFNIGPAMLAGAAVAAIERRLVRPAQVAVAALFTVAAATVINYLADQGQRHLDPAFAHATVTISLMLGIVALTLWLVPRIGWRADWLPAVAAGIVVVALFANLDDGRLAQTLRKGLSAPATGQLGLAYADKKDAGGAGSFLRSKQEAGEFFRYYGYNPAFLSEENNFNRDNYRSAWKEPLAADLLVNNRALALGLEDIQGYNPAHYLDYVRLVNAANGQPQEYHETNVLPSGLTSPLVSLLNVRYVVIPVDIPADQSRADFDYLTSNYPEVFRDDKVRVLAIPNALDRAWIVHEARQTTNEQALSLLDARAVDPRRTVLLTMAPPAMSAPPAGAQDTVTITRYEPDLIHISATAAADGMLVLSEIYDSGWKAFVDGKPASLYRADGALRAVAIPSGTHTVELRYEPSSLTYGLIITAATGFAVLAGIAALWFWQRREPTSENSRGQQFTRAGAALNR